MSQPVVFGRDPRPDPSSPLPPLRLEAVQRHFRHVAALTPSKTALVHAAARWTYGELESTSARLGGLLAARGVEPGDVVAIVTDRNPAFIGGMLGVLEAGAAFAVIDDASPAARVAACLAQTRPRHVLLAGGARRHAATIPPGLGPTCLPDDPAEMAALVAPYQAPSPPEVSANDLAYLLFTSGATGAPRCVAVGHAPLPRFIAWQRSELDLGPDERFSLLSRLSHHAMLRDVFTPLSLGATVHLPPARALAEGGALFAWMQEEGITASHLTPRIGRLMLVAADGRRLPDLRWLVWGGDVLPPALASAFAEIAPRAQQLDLYGTAETVQAVAFQRVDPTRDDRTIGRFIGDGQLLVLDSAGEAAPVDVRGELVVRSRYLARGYWPDLAATEGRFVPNPRGRDPGDRLFHTGDRARWRRDGSLELVGRTHDGGMVPDDLGALGGDVDRGALTTAGATSRSEAVRTEKEQVLARLWAEVLGVREVGRNESFYELGGDSLTALRVMVRMRTLGLDEAVCRQILHGKTIADIAADRPSTAPRAGHLPARPEGHSPLLLNVVRGLMVLVVIGAHWVDAVFRRWPDLLPTPAIGPLFNGSTPGFAIAFGMTLGFVHYPVYRQSPARARTLLRRGATLVGAGMALWAIDQLVFNSLGHGALHPLSSPLLYYVEALMTAPLWLRLLGDERDVTWRAATLGVVFELVHLGLRALPWPRGSWAWSHWALGEFSYFNLSAGTMLGLVLGFALRRRREVPSWYVAAGLALMVLGTVLSVEPDRVRLIEVSSDVELWKWLLYSGVILLILPMTDTWLRATVGARRPLAALPRITGTVGQLAFPFFILDFASRDLSKLCDLAGAPGLRLVVGAALFGSGAVYLVTRAYQAYYGSSREPAAVVRGDAPLMLPEA